MIVNQETCFNIPTIGELFFDKVLVQFGANPTVFTCLDSFNNIYLVVCNEDEVELSWIIVNVSYSSICELIKHQRPVFSVFSNTERIISVRINEDGTKITFNSYKSIDKEELPDKRAYLKLSFEKKMFLLVHYYRLCVLSEEISNEFEPMIELSCNYSKNKSYSSTNTKFIYSLNIANCLG
jgi:hypothetical protein